MSSLENTLKSTELFDVVSSSISADGKTHVCIGRIVDRRLWTDYLTDLLRAEHVAIEKGVLESNVLAVSKFYYVGPTGAVMFMWKVVCLNVPWLSANGPLVDGATWREGFKTKLGADGFPESVSLVSTTGRAKIPEPKDLGLASDMVGVTLSD